MVAIATVRKFSVRSQGKDYKVLLVLWDSDAGGRYLVQGENEQTLWLKDEDINAVFTTED